MLEKKYKIREFHTRRDHVCAFFGNDCVSMFDFLSLSRYIDLSLMITSNTHKLNFCALLVLFVLVGGVMASGRRSKSGAASSVRIKITRPTSIQLQQQQITNTRTSVSLHHGTNGRLRQATVHTETVLEEFKSIDHIDDFVTANDAPDISSKSDQQPVPANDEPKRPPVCSLLTCMSVSR